MDQIKDYLKVLELISEPAFTVQDGKVQLCNRAATACLVEPGTDILSLLATGQEEYAQLTDGCLSLRLKLHGKACGATVSRLQGRDLFRLEQEEVPAEIKAMALMSAQLRYPVSTLSVLASTQLSDSPAAPSFRQELSRILRLLNNATNTDHYLAKPVSVLEVRDVCAILREILEEADTLLSHVPLLLDADLPTQKIFAPVDEHGLRQAMYNLLSNAAKFSPAGSTIKVQATASRTLLRISVTDQGEGVPVAQQAGLFNRFSRQPGIEEGRQNLGLGMALVKAAASAHGGTVLVDTPEGKGTRVTMTLSVKSPARDLLRAPNPMQIIRSPDEGLIMLSDVLPTELFSPKN